MSTETQLRENLVELELRLCEQTRLLGTGTVVDTIHIDAMITPTITLSAPLTAVMGASMTGPRLLIMGMPAGGMMPALQGGSFTILPADQPQ